MRICTRCGEAKDESGFSLKNGKPDARCKRCKADISAEWRKVNPERLKQQYQDWYVDNGLRVQETNRAWRAANPEKAKAAQAAAMARWQKKFPDRAASHAAKRRAARVQATPAWADPVAMKQYYLIAEFLTRELGIPFSVDHVVPLKGETVCGLHAHTNLAILPLAWNVKKGNRTWPGKP